MGCAGREVAAGRSAAWAHGRCAAGGASELSEGQLAGLVNEEYVDLSAQLIARQPPGCAAHQELIRREPGLSEHARPAHLTHTQLHARRTGRQIAAAHTAAGSRAGRLELRQLRRGASNLERAATPGEPTSGGPCGAGSAPRGSAALVDALRPDLLEGAHHQVADGAMRHRHHANAPPLRHERGDTPSGRVRLACPRWALHTEVGATKREDRGHCRRHHVSSRLHRHHRTLHQQRTRRAARPTAAALDTAAIRLPLLSAVRRSNHGRSTCQQLTEGSASGRLVDHRRCHMPHSPRDRCAIDEPAQAGHEHEVITTAAQHPSTDSRSRHSPSAHTL